MTVLLVTIGIILLLAMALDVFVTVFTPEGHGGPLTRYQARLVWAVWTGLAPKRGQARETWLSLGGPLLAVLAPASWAVLLVGGFALLYYPFLADFLVSPGSLRVPWTEALYYSGFTAATLGTGDVVADLPALRVLTVVEALSGFALLSASLSYILAIYRENGRKVTLAAELALHSGLRRSGRPGALADERDLWLEHVARELLHVTSAHGQYPILHFFRSRRTSDSLTLQLAPLLDLPDSGVESDEGPVPGERLVAGAVDRYLDAAQNRFVPDHIEARDADVDPRYLRLLSYVGYEPADAGL